MFTILCHHLYIARTNNYDIAETTLEPPVAVVELDRGPYCVIGVRGIEFRMKIFDKDIKNHFIVRILSKPGDLLIWIDEDNGHVEGERFSADADPRTSLVICNREKRLNVDGSST